MGVEAGGLWCGAADDDVARALLTAIVRALGLARAALLIEESPGGRLVQCLAHGRVALLSLHPGEPPGNGPWSAALPIHAEGRAVGLLLVARTEGVPLARADASLAAGLAEGFARLVAHPRLSAELAQSRDLLARVDRLSALGTLAAGVAHEIRNPLVSVRTFMQLLPERLHDEDFRTRFRELALGEVERIVTLVNDVLTFSRPLPPELDLADLNELTGSTARLLEAEARKRGVTLRWRLEETLPAVSVDDARVKQVLTNVVLNAIEASEPAGRVEVATFAEQADGVRWCVVEVADSGEGVSAAEAERIFDPFFTTKNDGNGLGLWVASRIMNEHGGQIGVRSNGDGGAVFRIRFPVPEGRRGGSA